MPDLKISAGADPVTLVATDKVPMARSASTTAYAATMAELATYANGAYTPNYFAGTPSMDGTGAPGTAAFVSRGDHVHPSDTTRAPLASPTFTGTPAAPTPTTGDSTTRIATTAFVQAQMVASGAGVSTWNTRAGAVVLQQSDITAVGALHDVGRNLLHNPLFNVAQRGVGPFIAPNIYTLDRWFSSSFTGDTVSITQGVLADPARAAIGDEEAQSCLSNVFTGAAGAGNYVVVFHRMENVRRLAGKTVTISFGALASAATLKLGVNIGQNFGTGGSPSSTVQALATGNAITLSTAWTRYSTTIAIPSISGKTLGTNNDSNCYLEFWYSSGATNNAAAGNIGVQSGTIQLWGIQLEIGSVATPLDKPYDYGADLRNCQRFYQIGSVEVYQYGATTGAPISSMLGLPRTMRAMPTVTPTWSLQSNVNAPVISMQSAAAFMVYATTTAAATGHVVGTFTASAEL